MMSDAENWLTDQLKEYAGVTITYSRGASSVSLTATIGSTEFESDDSAGVYVRFRSIDFLVKASDLIISEAVITPARNDTITYDGDTYEVLPPGGQQVYQPTPHVKQLRIHTKQTAIG